MKFKIIFTFMSFVMMLSIPFSYFSEGKSLALEIEEEEKALEAIGDIELVYDSSGNFLGLEENSLEDLKGTEYEFLINNLRDEGLLIEDDGSFSIMNGQIRQGIRDAFSGSDDYRIAFTSCVGNSFGASLGESFVSQLLSTDYANAVRTLGSIGLRATVPGLVFTVTSCAVQAELDT